MHHIPQPQDQARILKKALEKLNLDIKHQDALQVIAQVMGHKNWKTMSAAAAAPIPPAPIPVAEPDVEIPLWGPADGKVYEGLVTVDMTMSGYVKVRAHSLAEARQSLRNAGHAQFPRGFEVDEGNYRGPSDFYLGDEDGVTREGKPAPEITTEGDHFGMADWKEDGLEYRIAMSRVNPDSNPEEEDDAEGEDSWSAVEVTLRLMNSAGVFVTKVITGYQVHSDFADWLQVCINEGDFVEDFEELIAELVAKQNA